MSASITWHGHACFQIISDSCNILIDPFFTGNSQAVFGWEEIEKPDVVLVTHLHKDHLGDTVEICKKTGALLGVIVGAADVIAERGVPSSQIINTIGFNIGGSVMVGKTRITMTEAFHTTEVGTCTGFIITLADGYTIYHAGDTGVFSNMALWGEIYPMDLALLPIGDVFTMDGRQAAYAAKLTRAKAVIPMHYGAFPVIAQTPDSFLKELKVIAPSCHAKVMIPGQTLPLP